eukprot:3699939-Rhodomonas_salina.1
METCKIASRTLCGDCSRTANRLRRKGNLDKGNLGSPGDKNQLFRTARHHNSNHCGVCRLSAKL